MFEGTEREPAVEPGSTQQPEPGQPVADNEQDGPEEGAGRVNAEATPKIADDAEHEQTQHEAPEDDVGVPEDPGAEKQ